MATYSDGQTAVLGDIVQHITSKKVGFVHQLDPFPGGASVDYFAIIGSGDLTNAARGSALFAGPVAVGTTPFTEVLSNFKLLYPARP